MAKLLTQIVLGVSGVVLSAIAITNVGEPPRGWIRVEGVVVGFSADEDSGQAPIVEYRDAAGGVHRVVSPLAGPEGFVEKLGQTVSVAYDPANPENARLVSGSATVAWVLALAVGILFAAVGGGTLVYDLRTARGQARVGLGNW